MYFALKKNNRNDGEGGEKGGDGREDEGRYGQGEKEKDKTKEEEGKRKKVKQKINALPVNVRFIHGVEFH